MLTVLNYPLKGGRAAPPESGVIDVHLQVTGDL
jgi:hypothetical protein